MQLFNQIIRYNLRRTYYKMIISKKIKTINNEIGQNKAQFDLDGQTVKISTLLSENGRKYGKLENMFYPKRLAAIKTLEYTPLGTEFRKRTSLAEKQHQKLGKVFEPNKKEEDKTKNKRSRAMSTLFYSDDDDRDHRSSSYEFLTIKDVLPKKTC